MWWISIILDIILIISSFIFCTLYYNQNYGDPIKQISLTLLQSHNALYGNIFQVMHGFSNYSYNILLKGIITIICIFVVHFTDSLWITYLYLPYLLLTYWIYGKRVKQYKSENESQKKIIRPSFVVSFSLPLFHTMFLILIYLTYVLNV